MFGNSNNVGRSHDHFQVDVEIAARHFVEFGYISSDFAEYSAYDEADGFREFEDGITEIDNHLDSNNFETQTQETQRVTFQKTILRRKRIQIGRYAIHVGPKELFEKHHANLSALPFILGLVKYMSSGPVVQMVWEHLNVVKIGRQMLGATNPANSLPGEDFYIRNGREIIHGSGAANKKINLYFTKKELVS
uniref:nucleoside-diphosphate kinase n=1 Tax=Megaselia scalaris TaxID=36166 RepID=T1GM60_MEGSC